VVQILSENKNFPNPADYRLATIHGYFLDRSMSLRDYGLGVLFLTWQVKLHKPTNEARRNLIFCKTQTELTLTFHSGARICS
jgi:hypothetical protein